MREILFKAKRTGNGEWVEGHLLKETTVYDEIITRIYQPKSKGTFIKFEVDPETVCQYTGLTDKNGKKIWENDIVKCGGNLVVTWKEKLASFCLSKKGWLYQHFFGEAVNAEDVEIIGNIFDNPELLNQ